MYKVLGAFLTLFIFVGIADAQVNPDDYRYTMVEGKDHIGMPFPPPCGHKPE